MKNLARVSLVLLYVSLVSCQEQILEPVPENLSIDPITSGTIDTSVPLTEAEITSLTFMREEEKMARDVYLTFHDTYLLNSFKNIAASEQQHTDAVASILRAFDLPDPVELDEIGNFQNEFLMEVYQDLIDQGMVNSLEALKVGALIEEIDINDLRLAKELVSNTAVISLYENLEKGSRNHLRSFYKSIIKTGSDYEPSVLNDDLFYEIVNSDMEHGN